MKPTSWKPRLLALVTLALRVTLFVAWFQAHGPYPRLGVSLDGRGQVVAVLGPPAEGVLEVGDRIVRLGGRPVGQAGSREAFTDEREARAPLAIEFERSGRSVHAVLPPLRLPAAMRFRVAAFPLLLAMVGPIVAFLLVWRRGTRPIPWVFQEFATVSGLGVLATVLPYELTGMYASAARWRPLHELVLALYPALFLNLTVLMSRPVRGPEPRRIDPGLVVVLSAYAASLAGWVARRSGLAVPFLWPDAGSTTLAVVLGIGLLGRRYLFPAPGPERTLEQRVVVVWVGLTLLLSNVMFEEVPLGAWLLAFVMGSSQSIAIAMLVTAWLTVPLLLAYLIADEAELQPRRLLADSLSYLTLSVLLAASYLLVVVGLQRAFTDITGERDLAHQIVAALVLALVFAPMREFVQRLFDRLFDRDPSALRAVLDAAGGRLLAAFDREEVRTIVEAGLADGLRCPIVVRWPDVGAPTLVLPERVPGFAQGPVDALLHQASVRRDNLRLIAERAAAVQAELRALQAQVQPHFLFNALNALAYLIETDPPAAQRFTDRLAGMLRYTVDAGRREAVLLSEEIAFVEDYLGVARERYENTLVFRSEVTPADLSTSVPPLLLQPLVENSLKHGLRPGATTLHMTLRTERSDGRFVLWFEDDGAPDGSGPPGLGFGLENLTQRVRHFGGEGAEVRAGRSPEGGFVVRMAWTVVSGGRE